MFTPNLIGEIRHVTGRDVHARPTMSGWLSCPFGMVSNLTSSQKTTVRADSSASRGSADETVSPRSKILVTIISNPKIGSRFRFQGITYDISGVHPRFSVTGDLDHYECDLSVLPDAN